MEQRIMKKNGFHALERAELVRRKTMMMNDRLLGL